MSEISAVQVKSLRDATGLGMMECKKALVESDGDIGKANELLRIRSQAKAGKVSGRSTMEGRIGILVNDSAGVIAQVGCETDFVAKDENFISFVDFVLKTALEQEDVSNLASVPGLEDARQGLVLKLGENISVGEVASIKAAGGSLASYVHQGSKIGVLATLDRNDGNVGRDLCMHIAAMRPSFVSPEDVPAEVLEKERDIYSEQLAESGKPPEIISKIVDGKIGKYLEEACLLLQPFIKDEDKTVGEVLKERKAEIRRFVRLEIC